MFTIPSVSRATVGAKAVDLTWGDGDTVSLSNMWLRDNCQCRECRVEQTTEKAFRITSVPITLRPASAEVLPDVHGHDEHLLITWPDGHRTVYARELIRSLAAPMIADWQPWDRSFTPTNHEWSGFLNDDAAASAAITEFLLTGAVVLTGAPTTPNTLEDLAPRLGPIHEVLFERIHNVEVNPGGYNIAHTALELPPHNDMASYSWPPSVQALHFLANETPGGESVIVDGWAVLDGLRDDSPDLFDALCQMPVPFRQFDQANETFTVAPIVRIDADEQITALRYSNQLMQPLNPTRPGVTEFYEAYHELSSRLLDPAVQAEFRVESGEILLVAAHRVLHARRAFEPTGRRHLQDAYFEYDNVRNHLTVLEGRQTTLIDPPELAAQFAPLL